MSRRFTFTADAHADVLDIWRCLAENLDIRAADGVVAEIYDACDSLADMPGMGHYREELLDRQYRFWLVGNHLVIYRWEMRPIQVLRVLHAARDLGAVFSEHPSR